MTKKRFVLRIDEKHFKALENWAVEDYRSVNGQIEWLINESLKKHNQPQKKEKDNP